MALIEELVDFEQVTANNMVVAPADDGINMPLVIDHPVGVKGLAKVGPKRAPDLGEHSEEILSELGYSAADIERLAASGII
jgi:formyl-CoA transferase